MRQFVLQTLGNTVSLMLAFGLVPGLAFINAQPLADLLRLQGIAERYPRGVIQAILFTLVVLLLGLIFTAIDRYIKPLLLALTGRFIVWSMGASILIVNVLIFWLFIAVAPVTWQVTNPQWVRIVIGGVFLSAVKLVVETVTGINQPRVLKGNPDETYWRFIERIPLVRGSGLVESIRVSQIYNKLLQFATEVAVGKGIIGNIRARVYQFMYREPNPMADLSVPEKTRILMESLGPTWVKFGQMIASQAETLPAEWAEQLTRLQSSAEPFPSEQVVQIIAAELGAPPQTIYASFDLAPLAAASTAQVHRATLHDGTQVAVKVQRPDIMAKTKADLGIIQNVAGVLQKRSQAVANLDLKGITRQFAKGVMKELDYRNEAYQTRRLADNMAGMAGIHVPAIYMDLSTSRVMTAEFVKGIKLTKTEQIDAAGLHRVELANNFLAAIIKQLLVDGFFHGDPHPGNLFVDTDTGVITFLDLGLIGEMTQQQRYNFLDLLFTMTRSNPDELAQVAQGLAVKTRPVDERAYRAAITDVYYRYMVYGETTISFNEAMTAITDVLARFGLHLDSSLTMAIKAMIQAGQSLYALDPTIDLAAAAVAKAKVLLAQEFTVESVVDSVQSQLLRAGRQIVRNLPDLETATMSWVAQYKRGKFVITVDTADLTKGVDRFSLAVNRLTLGIILVGMLIGSALALASLRAWLEPSGDLLYPMLLAVLFGIVFCFSGYVALRMAGSLSEPEEPYKE